MNIFYLHPDPKTAAKMHCDKHCVKMVLETAQLLSTAHRELDGDELSDRRGLYKSTHRNHPSAVWARANRENYDWLVGLFKGLLEEYTARYGQGAHASSKILLPISLSPLNLKSGRVLPATPVHARRVQVRIDHSCLPEILSRREDGVCRLETGRA
jgi:hypothetical protein